MMTREEEWRLPRSHRFDPIEDGLRGYALAYCNVLMSREHGWGDATTRQYERRCEAWQARLAALLSPARFAFELDEARRFAEADAAELRPGLQRRAAARRAAASPGA